MNQTLNKSTDQQKDDLLAYSTAEQIRRDLNLQYVPVFNWAKALRIVWSSFCLIATLVFFKIADGNLNKEVIGSVFAVLFMMSIYGMPIALRLDRASALRFEEFMNSQRDEKS